MLTLGQLMVRSQLNDGFVRVHVVDGLTMAVYRPRNAKLEEHWQALPGTDRLFLKRVKQVKSRNASTR
jgi:hypothetical protein